MKILFVSHEFTFTGAPLCLLDVARALEGDAHECILFGPPGGNLESTFRRENLHLVLCSRIVWLYRGGRTRLGQIVYLPIRLIVNLILATELFFRFIAAQADVIYLNSFASRFAAIPARLAGKLVVWHVHEYLPSFQMLSSLVVRLCSDVVIANSKATLSRWNGFVPFKKALVLYNPFTLGTEDHRNTSRKYDIVTVGRIAREKGFDVLLEALRILSLRGRRLHLAAVGTFDSRAYESEMRMSLRRHAMEDQISWIGETERPRDFISLGRVFVLPSFRDGFGRVILDAIACRVPVIASNVGGIPEIVCSSEIGFLVPPGDPVALAEKICNVLDDPTECDKLVERAHASAVERFGVAKFDSKVRQLFAGLSGRPA